jgi:hypothetical protein
MQTYLASIIAGCLIPMLPIMVEYGLTHAVHTATFSVTGVVYTAAVGMTSRNRFVVFLSFFCATLCGVIYAGKLYNDINQVNLPYVEYGPPIAQFILYLFIIGYAIERFGRHYVEQKPFIDC